MTNSNAYSKKCITLPYNIAFKINNRRVVDLL